MDKIKSYDALIIGAGFSGMHLVDKLRKLKFNILCIDAGKEVGGTWYWNRYPGARCDVESVEYSFSFNDEIQQEWNWTERYATQPEIHAYQKYVADKLDLRKDIQFETTVTAAEYDTSSAKWIVTTNHGEKYQCSFLIAATGVLSVPLVPTFKGLDSYKGELIHTGRWPHDKVDFKGKRVAVIGTGSTGIQTIPEVSKEADQVIVFHRDANYSVPARNALLEESFKDNIKKNYRDIRQKARESFNGLAGAAFSLKPASDFSETEQQQILENLWNKGGTEFMGAFCDIITNLETNKIASEFLDRKIKETVKDPQKAAILTPPEDLAIGARRICVDSHYYDTYNKEHVELVDVKDNPISEITQNGLKLEDGTEYSFDILILATGYDAMTGALNKIDIKGKSGVALKQKWSEGPKNYLGLAIEGFPNFFMVTGPGSPSVFANMVSCIEQHVEWISNTLDYLKKNNYQSIEVKTEAENEWVKHVNEVANSTLLPTAASWYLGANVPGKPRVFMPYVGGFSTYGEKINQVARDNYQGFSIA